MHRFYAEPGSLRDGMACLSPEDTAHALKILRLAPGDTVELFSDGSRYLAEIADAARDAVRVRVLEELPTTEPRLRVTLFQGLPKADKLELIVQKAVELGAEAVVPVAMERSVVRLTPESAPRKRDRWQKIAREACKQSGRCAEPTVGLPVTAAELARELSRFDAAVVPWEDARGYSLNAFHAEHPDIRTLAVVIGPEGGITPAEIEALQTAGCRPVTLGPRILRTETAGLAALSALMCLYGEMM